MHPKVYVCVRVNFAACCVMVFIYSTCAHTVMLSLSLSLYHSVHVCVFMLYTIEYARERVRACADTLIAKWELFIVPETVIYRTWAAPSPAGSWRCRRGDRSRHNIRVYRYTRTHTPMHTHQTHTHTNKPCVSSFVRPFC